MQLTQGIHRARALYPEKVALVSADQSYTWEEFADRIARLAGCMRELGVQSGDRVAMLANNSARYVEFYFASLWAGAVMVPVNVRWALPEIIDCFEDCEPYLLLHDAAFAETACAVSDAANCVKHVLAVDDDDYETRLRQSRVQADLRRQDEDLACLFYTGGTTGRAKGVMLSHRNLLANTMTAIANLGLSGDSVHLHVSPMFHVAGGARLFSTTAAGATHAVIPSFDPEVFLAAIERFRVTVTVVVPTMLNRLVNYPDLTRFDLSSLKLLSYGASPMPEALLRQAFEVLPGIRFLQSYGMTELSPVATMLAPRYHTFEGADAGRTSSAGQAVYNAEVSVRNEQDSALPANEIGEVCVRGPMVMQGYWRQPELTARTIRDGWMHTGDAGYLDKDGFLFLVDRVKDMIVTGGENVYSAEVENVLQSHPSVFECAVIGIPSAEWGEAVHAVVVPHPNQTPSQTELMEFCRAKIAAYKCPKSISMSTSELPKSGVGKVLKTELRKPFWSTQTDSGRNIH